MKYCDYFRYRINQPQCLPERESITNMTGLMLEVGGGSLQIPQRPFPYRSGFLISLQAPSGG